jgi:hypothetical protein
MHNFRISIWVFAIACGAFGLGNTLENWRLTAEFHPLTFWSQIAGGIVAVTALAWELKQGSRLERQ